MNNKEDARIVKTKSSLLTAFKELLTKKSFEDITVNEICERANVRRATFYKHFSDKYEFLKYLVGSLRDEFDAKRPTGKRPDATPEYYLEYLRALVSFLMENEKMVKNALASDVLPSLIEVIKDKNYEDTCARLRESVAKGMILPASVEITASMMTGAVASTLLRWFKNEKSISPDALINEIGAVIASIQG